MMKNKRIWFTVGLVGLLLVLAAGAYTAVQLLARAAQPAAETAVLPSGRVMESVQIDNGGAPVAVRTTLLPAVELPQEESAAFGIVVAAADDTLMIGTGNIELSVDVEVNGETGQETTSVVPTTDGPEVEVVITNDTLIYRDVTDLTADLPSGESGEQTIQQQVRQVESAADIDKQAEVEVWGEQRGDRIVARVLVFGPLAGGAFE